MVENIGEALRKLRDRVATLARSHKKIVGKYKKRLQEEMNNASREKAENEIKINTLQKQLNDALEKAASATAAAAANGAGGAEIQVDFDAIKNKTYFEAQINSLKEELQNEISKSAKIAAEKDLNISHLEQSLEKATTSAEEAEERSEQKNIELKKETEEQKKIIEEKDNHIQEHEENIQKLESQCREHEESIDNLNKDVEKVNQTVAERDGTIEELNQQIKKMTRVIKDLEYVNRTYDVIDLEEKVQAIVEILEPALESNNQATLNELLTSVYDIDRTSRKTERKIIEKLSNTLHVVTELKCRVENSICRDKAI